MDFKKIASAFYGTERADGAAPEDWATGIVKVGCILVIGVVILQGVVQSANINNTSTFYNLYTTVNQNIQSGYTLSALMVLALGAGAVMRFLGFM